MKAIHIFRAGKHTSAGGNTLSFSEADLQKSAEAYDPKLMEAPIVVGHPQDNGPAFGWIQGVSFSEKGLHAEPHQINDDFAEMVSKGSYKKVSASFYGPDAAANPVPGTFYLRHVGFLGAMPPSIKGLEALAFNETDDDVVEFSQELGDDEATEGLMRKIAETFGIKPKTETADHAENNGETGMTEEELKAAQDKLTADQATHDANVTAFNESQEAEATAKAAARKATIGERVDKLVKDGFVLPAQRDAVAAFAENLDAEAVVEFGEGDDKTSTDATEFYFKGLEVKGKGPDFSEHSDDDGEGGDKLTPEALGKQAQDYMEAEAQAGRTVSITQAVSAVLNK